MFSQAALNASLNGTSAVLLACGYAAIRSGKMAVHKRFMLSAFWVSVVFLISYVVYHIRVGHVVFHGHEFKLFIWEVPALVEPNSAIRSTFAVAHEFGAKALVALIALHAGAALFHRFVLRDRVLQRMLPWQSESAEVRTNRLVLLERYLKKAFPLSSLAHLKMTVLPRHHAKVTLTKRGS